MNIHLITAFPETFDGFFESSIISRALKQTRVRVYRHFIRDYAKGKHKQIDDYPYGGGAGMILKPEPIFECVKDIYNKYELMDTKLIFLTPAGERYTQKKAVELSLRNNLVLLCGHYKGVDQRVLNNVVDEELSIGDFVLTGGETAAMCVLDSVIRLLPGVLGDIDSAFNDSFQTGLLDHPHYTRPVVFNNEKVPDVLLSGNHAEIEKWRREEALRITKKKRYDLYKSELNKNSSD